MELIKWGEEPKAEVEVRLRLMRNPANDSIEVRMVDAEGRRIPSGTICRFYEDEDGKLSMELAPGPNFTRVTNVNHHIRVTRQEEGRDGRPLI